MSKGSALAIRLVTKGLSVFPLKFLGLLEVSAQHAQGKGWQGASVDREVAEVLGLACPRSREHLVVADVGANVGDWTAALLKAAPGAQVYAFEPSQVAFARLSQRFNKDSRVVLVRSAVSDKDGQTTLWSDSPGSALGSLTRRRLDHVGIEFEVTESVQTTTLDSWCSDSHGPIDILKIDVEGHEWSVLKGASHTLKNVQVVQFEFGGTDIDTRCFFQDFFYFFDEAGFELLRLAPGGLIPVCQYSEVCETFAFTIYFARRHGICQDSEH